MSSCWTAELSNTWINCQKPIANKKPHLSILSYSWNIWGNTPELIQLITSVKVKLDILNVFTPKLCPLMSILNSWKLHSLVETLNLMVFPKNIWGHSLIMDYLTVKVKINFMHYWRTFFVWGQLHSNLQDNYLHTGDWQI